MVGIATIENALRHLSRPDALRWIPNTNLRNATVTFEKRFVTTKNGKNVFTGIDKVVKRADGQTIRGQYTPDGSLLGAVQESSNGKIVTSFGAQNYDKVVTINNNSGESIVRLGHKGRPNSFTDTFTRSNGRSVQGDFTDEYNRLRAEVQNTKPVDPLVAAIAAKWQY